MQWIMADTGWDLQNNCSSGLFADINFDGTASSQAALAIICGVSSGSVEPSLRHSS